MTCRLRKWSCGFVSFVLATALRAHDPLPIQGDFSINGTIPGDQADPVVAVDSDGDFVVAWTSDGQDGELRGIYARQYNDDGTPADAEFKVNQTTAGDQHAPALAGTDSGDFAVAWVGPDAGGLGIFARAYESNGTPASGEVAVNTTTAGAQSAPAVAILESGDFLVVWQGPGPSGLEIWGRLFTEGGLPLSGEFQINTSSAGDQIDPTAGSSDEFDEFVVAWTGFDADGRGIFAQRVAMTGALVGSEIPVNSNTAGEQVSPAVALSGIDLDIGDENLFVVVWQGPDADGSGVFVQRYDDDGTPFAAEEQINLDSTGDQQNPTVAVDDGAEDELFFVVSWQEAAGLFAVRGAPILIRGRRIRGHPPTPPPPAATFALNATGTLVAEPAVSARPDGWFVGVWESAGGDGDGFGVVGRRFQVPLFRDGFENGTAGAWSVASPLLVRKHQP